MKLSKTHQKLAETLAHLIYRRILHTRVLEHHENYLGHNWRDVLNFWIYLDTLSPEQWRIVNDRYYELDDAKLSAAKITAENAARAGVFIVSVLESTSFIPIPVTWATLELFGSHEILDQYKSLIFFPMFLNL